MVLRSVRTFCTSSRRAARPGRAAVLPSALPVASSLPCYGWLARDTVTKDQTQTLAAGQVSGIA